MDILKLIAVFLGATILFTSCSVYEKKELTYQTGAFRAKIEWESGGTKFSASVTASAPHAPAGDAKDYETPVPRDVELCFLSPASMRGITVTRIAGAVCATLRGIKIDSVALMGYLAVADLFDVSGDVTDVRAEDSGSGKLTRIDVSDGDSAFSVYLSSETENPVRIVADRYDMRIVWFER